MNISKLSSYFKNFFDLTGKENVRFILDSQEIQTRNSKFRTKTKIVMIGLAIFCVPLNTPCRIQNLQFTGCETHQENN